MSLLVENVSFSYGKRSVLHNISFSVEKGEFLSVLGPNGVGKSTLSSSLAVHYARKGLKTALLDGDIGLRCADLMLGLQEHAVPLHFGRIGAV